MHDPVILSDGHTYERRYIEKWLLHKAMLSVGRASCGSFVQLLASENLSCPLKKLRILQADVARAFEPLLDPAWCHRMPRMNGKWKRKWKLILRLY